MNKIEKIKIGDVFGKWITLRKDDSKLYRWICRCECGTIKSVSGYNLLSGESKSCNCVWSGPSKRPKLIQPGDVFNYLTVLREDGRSRNRIIWLCKCICGNDTNVITYQLKSGKTKSCGCLRVETIKKIRTTHGKSNTNEYSIWSDIIKRTTNKNADSYKDYGNRGIKMCDEWRNSFENFLNDMGNRPSKFHTIERSDNDKNYEPGNCIWATIDIQARNKRNNIIIEKDGESMILEDWAKKLNVTRSVFKTIIKNNSDYKITEKCQK